MIGKMLASLNEILHLIPQRHPMLMVDGLIETDDRKTVSRFRLDPTNIFCASGYFQEAGIIENMAQTAALRNGYAAGLSGSDMKIGFIGSLKNLRIYALPEDTDTLQTTVYVLYELINATVIRGEVHVKNRLMAVVEMNIFLQEV